MSVRTRSRGRESASASRASEAESNAAKHARRALSIASARIVPMRSFPFSLAKSPSLRDPSPVRRDRARALAAWRRGGPSSAECSPTRERSVLLPDAEKLPVEPDEELTLSGDDARADGVLARRIQRNGADHLSILRVEDRYLASEVDRVDLPIGRKRRRLVLFASTD